MEKKAPFPRRRRGSPTAKAPPHNPRGDLQTLSQRNQRASYPDATILPRKTLPTRYKRIFSCSFGSTTQGAPPPRAEHPRAGHPNWKSPPTMLVSSVTQDDVLVTYRSRIHLDRPLGEIVAGNLQRYLLVRFKSSVNFNLSFAKAQHSSFCQQRPCQPVNLVPRKLGSSLPSL